MRTLVLHSRYFGNWPIKDNYNNTFQVCDGSYDKYTIKTLHVRIRGEHENVPDLVITIENDKTSAMVSYQDDKPEWSVNYDVDLSSSFFGLKLDSPINVVVKDLFADDVGLITEVAVDIVASRWWGLGTEVVNHAYASFETVDFKTAKRHK
jgi:hypothetical protein